MGNNYAPTSWDNGPRRIQASIIDPVVHELGSAEDNTTHALSIAACAIIERDTIEVTDADNYLDDVTLGLLLLALGDVVSCQEG